VHAIGVDLVAPVHLNAGTGETRRKAQETITGLPGAIND
jgi:hypothetical protein